MNRENLIDLWKRVNNSPGSKTVLKNSYNSENQQLSNQEVSTKLPGNISKLNLIETFHQIKVNEIPKHVDDENEHTERRDIDVCIVESLRSSSENISPSQYNSELAPTEKNFKKKGTINKKNNESPANTPTNLIVINNTNINSENQKKIVTTNPSNKTHCQDKKVENQEKNRDKNIQNENLNKSTTAKKMNISSSNSSKSHVKHIPDLFIVSNNNQKSTINYIKPHSAKNIKSRRASTSIDKEVFSKNKSIKKENVKKNTLNSNYVPEDLSSSSAEDNKKIAGQIISNKILINARRLSISKNEISNNFEQMNSQRIQNKLKSSSTENHSKRNKISLETFTNIGSYNQQRQGKYLSVPEIQTEKNESISNLSDHEKKWTPNNLERGFTVTKVSSCDFDDRSQFNKYTSTKPKVGQEIPESVGKFKNIVGSIRSQYVEDVKSRASENISSQSSNNKVIGYGNKKEIDITDDDISAEIDMQIVHNQNLPQESNLLNNNASPGNLQKSIIRSNNKQAMHVDSVKIKTQNSIHENRPVSKCGKYCENIWIHPQSKRKGVWDFLLAIIIVIYSFVFPYRYAFVTKAGLENDINWKIFWGIIDGFFLIDIILVFFTPYLNEDFELVTDKKKIACRYLKFNFWVDLIAINPLEYLAYFTLIRLVKLARLKKMLSALTGNIACIELKETNNCLGSLIRTILDVPGVGPLVSIGLFVIIFCHLLACAWYQLCYQSAKNNDELYLSWIEINVPQDASYATLYTYSIYFIIQTLTTVGYGDVQRVLAFEQLQSILLMFIGVVFFSLTISHLTSIIAGSDTRQIALDDKLRILDNIHKRYNLPDEVLIGTRIILERNKKNDSHEVDSANEFLNELSYNIRLELGYIMYKDKVRDLIFFDDMDEKMISLVGPHLIPKTFPANECIYSVNDPSNTMFFLVSGKVSYVIPKYDNFAFIHVKCGYHFGDIELLYDERRKFTVYTTEKSELLMLSKDDFYNLFFRDFPLYSTKLHKTARIRIKRQLKAYAFAELFAIETLKRYAQMKNSQESTKIGNLLVASHSEQFYTILENKKRKQNNNNAKFKLDQIGGNEMDEFMTKIETQSTFIADSYELMCIKMDTMEKQIDLQAQNIENFIHFTDDILNGKIDCGKNQVNFQSNQPKLQKSHINISSSIFPTSLKKSSFNFERTDIKNTEDKGNESPSKEKSGYHFLNNMDAITELFVKKRDKVEEDHFQRVNTFNDNTERRNLNTKDHLNMIADVIFNANEQQMEENLGILSEDEEYLSENNSCDECLIKHEILTKEEFFFGDMIKKKNSI